MQREMKSQQIHLCLLRYPGSFTISLRKDGRLLGFRFERPACNELDHLRITELLTDGALPEHNEQQALLGCWHRIVLPGMEIQAANCVRGDAMELASELARCETV